MNSDVVALILTAVTCTAGATVWIVSAIKDVSGALRIHAAKDEATHEDHGRRIISLELWRKKGRK